MNFQDVIRESYDDSNKGLKVNVVAGTITAAGQATVTLYGTPTIYAVVNTSAAGQASIVLDSGLNNIGFATVAVSTPTLYAVVNTGAVGITNSIVTVANTVPVTFSGNVTLDDGSLVGLLAGVNNIGFASVTPVASWPDPKTYIGLASVSGTVGLAAGVNNIGFATVTPTSIARTISGNITLSDSKGYIGLTSVSGTVGLAAGANAIGLVTVTNTVPVTFSGNVTLDDGSLTGLIAGAAYVGLATVDIGTIKAWTDPKTYIGLVTVANTVPVTFSGNVTLDDGSLVGLLAGVNGIGFATVNVVNQPALVAGAAYVGLATVDVGTIKAWADPKTYIGLVTVGHTVTVAAHALTAGVAGIGFATVNVVNQPALVAGAANIGCVTLLNQPALIAGTANIGCVTLLNQPALIASSANIGCVTQLNQPALIASSANIGSVSILGGGIGINAGVNNIGFATVTLSGGMATVTLGTRLASTTDSIATKNAGTNKTLLGAPITLSTSSQATLAVPTNANTMYITNLVLNSDATVRVSILSGVTYLTGNASIGITLNPGGGWVESGSPDSPVYIGCPSGSLVVQKFDMTGTSAKIGGKVIYFQE